MSDRTYLRYQGALKIDFHKTHYIERTIKVTTVEVYILLKLNIWRLQWYENHFY